MTFIKELSTVFARNQTIFLFNPTRNKCMMHLLSSYIQVQVTNTAAGTMDKMTCSEQFRQNIIRLKPKITVSKTFSP